MPNIPTSLPGDVWLDTSSNSLHVHTGGTGATIGTLGIPSGWAANGAHTHTLITSQSQFVNTFGKPFPYNITFHFNDKQYTMSEEKLAGIIDSHEELVKLLEEQPSVKEAYDSLQILIKLYRE